MGEVGGTTLYLATGTIHLSLWMDCAANLIAPAWRSAMNSGHAIHGRTVIDAFDLRTGEAVDCPLSAEEFGRTIEWEDFAGRRVPHRPNAEWITAISYENLS